MRSFPCRLGGGAERHDSGARGAVSGCPRELLRVNPAPAAKPTSCLTSSMTGMRTSASRILANCHTAMGPGGRLLIVESVLAQVTERIPAKSWTWSCSCPGRAGAYRAGVPCPCSRRVASALARRANALICEHRRGDPGLTTDTPGTTVTDRTPKNSRIRAAYRRPTLIFVPSSTVTGLDWSATLSLARVRGS